MKRTCVLNWYSAKAALLLLGICVFSPKSAWAQQLNCAPWNDVPEFNGTISVTGSGSYVQPGETVTINESATITFDARTNLLSCDSFIVWPAQTTANTVTYLINDTTTDSCPSGGSSSIVSQAGGTSPLSAINYLYLAFAPGGGVFNFEADTYSVAIHSDSVPGQQTTTDCDGSVVNQIQTPIFFGPLGFNNDLWIYNVPLPAKLGPLSGSTVISNLPGVSWTISWNIAPVLPPMDLLVTIPNFLSWRPSGGKNETDPGIGTQSSGNVLPMSAQLVDKATQQPTPFGPDKMTFALVQVSHEPGVAMNWPAKANLINPPPPDMSFMSFDSTVNINPNFQFNSDGTQADFVPQDSTSGNPPIGILLIPYDWGGWATLNVTATVAGQTIQGHLVVPGVPPDPNETNILLPNRQSDSLIADSWKATHNASALTDNDDSESKPNGDGQPGDGFTLYEEYRGFYMGCANTRAEPQPEGTPRAVCQHIEGDPNSKDFFVVNRIGSEVIEGIGLFQFASGLNVHYRGLQPSDVGPKGDPSYRVINFNHSAAPHEVDQHVVFVGWSAGNAATSSTFPTPDFTCGIPSRQCGTLPKHADHIEITRIFLEPEYQSVDTSGYQPIDIAVAHELSHSVDVYHHGDGVDHYEFWTLGPNNTIMMQLLFGNLLSGTPQPIVVVAEDRDPTGPQSFGIVSILGLDQVYDGNPKDANGNPLKGRRMRVANRICNGQVVASGGESGGDALDVMRYDDTETYIPIGFPNSRIWVRDIAFAVDLTDHPGGTGVNNPNRKPRPRYGDADSADQRGNDRSQVDVNDSHTEIQRGQFVCSAP